MDGLPSETRAREIHAPAKINLALHVLGRRTDGYHELDSLVAFAHEGDHLRIEPAERDELVLSGLFGHLIPSGGENIVLRALMLARATLRKAGRDLPAQRVHLHKNLPPSSGIGGGSADAAALLRLVAQEHSDSSSALQNASLRLGADVPMCFGSRSARVTGVGECIECVAIGSPVFVLLVNPRVEVSTPAVFERLTRRDNAPMPPPPATGFADHGALVSYLRACRNDLGEPAILLAPPVGVALRAVEMLGASLTRMSGSGATVFGLFENRDACQDACRTLTVDKPDWWVRATELHSQDKP